LLFADHGLDTAQISSLLAIWSVSSFVLDIPSGALADTVSRCRLLIVGSLCIASGFAVWTCVPSYLGFAAGFLLWGTGGALHSGTFEALLYDELAARGATAQYARIQGFARSAGEAGALLGIVLGAPLFAWGGYALVGLVSVGVVLAQALIALSFPAVPAIAQDDEPAYWQNLRSGIAEVVRNPRVRGVVLLAATLLATALAVGRWLPRPGAAR
jgi:MFS family permease